MNTYLMECGHVAQGTDLDGNPVCVSCGATVIAATKPDLTGRKAKCAFHNAMHPNNDDIVDSNYQLAFFEYKGPGSAESKESCANCGFYEAAHYPDPRYSHKEHTVACRHCYNFRPHGPFEFDTYYCGCRGWD